MPQGFAPVSRGKRLNGHVAGAALVIKQGHRLRPHSNDDGANDQRHAERDRVALPLTAALCHLKRLKSAAAAQAVHHARLPCAIQRAHAAPPQMSTTMMQPIKIA